MLPTALQAFVMKRARRQKYREVARHRRRRCGILLAGCHLTAKYAGDLKGRYRLFAFIRARKYRRVMYRREQLSISSDRENRHQAAAASVAWHGAVNKSALSCLASSAGMARMAVKCFVRGINL